MNFWAVVAKQWRTMPLNAVMVLSMLDIYVGSFVVVISEVGPAILCQQASGYNLSNTHASIGRVQWRALK